MTLSTSGPSRRPPGERREASHRATRHDGRGRPVACRFKWLAALVAACAAVPAAAKTQWVVCDLVVRIEPAAPGAQRLAGQVVSVDGPAHSECPARDARIAFLPETPDYQSVLPRRRWPKAGTHARIRYRYLIGACKHTPVCKIEHHSVLP